MRIVSLSVYKWNQENSYLLCSEMNLQDLWFYQRGVATDLIKFNARMISGRTQPGQQASIQLEQNIGTCHCWTTHDGISACVMTDLEYPEKAAYTLLNKIIMEFRTMHGTALPKVSADTAFSFPPLEAYLKDWQNPHEADKLLKVEKELFEVQNIVHKNLEDLLQRGEQMDELMAKSKDLNEVSVGFYKKAKKQNESCCTIF